MGEKERLKKGNGAEKSFSLYGIHYWSWLNFTLKALIYLEVSYEGVAKLKTIRIFCSKFWEGIQSQGKWEILLSFS